LARYYLQSEREDHSLRIVELRFLAGLSIEDTLKVLELSPATVKRTLGHARLWLQRELSRGIQG